MDAIRTLGQLAPTIPLFVYALLLVRGRRPPAMGLLLALAFFVSFLADSLGLWLFEHQRPNLWLTYVYAPIQFGLLAAIVAPSMGRPAVWVGFVLVVLASVSRGTWGMPETFVQVTGGAWVSLVAMRHKTAGAYRWPIYVYCLGAIPWLLLMGLIPLGTVWLGAWAVYQAVRVTALGLLAHTILTLTPPRLEVVDAGQRVGQGTGRAGHAGRAGADSGDLALARPPHKGTA